MKTPPVSLLLGVCVLLLSALTASAGVILEIPPHPVPTGSDVTLRCRLRNGDIIAAYFFFDGSRVGSASKSELIITNVQQSDEGLYSCSTDVFGSSPRSFLRVKESPHLHTSTEFSRPVNTPALFPLVTASTIPQPSTIPHPSTIPGSSSILVPVVVGLALMVVLVLVGVLIPCSKLKGGRGADSVSVGFCGGDGCEEPAEKSLRWRICLCFSGLFLLTAAGVCVLLLLSALSVPAVSRDGSEVEVFEGVESVLLSCQVSVHQGGDMRVVWKHREFRITVHVHGSNVDDLRNQSQRYTNRTSVRADALQTGDLSLTLRNPTGSDSGTYTCILQTGGREESQAEVQLKVKASSVSVRRLFCHLVVFCPYCISTGLLLSIYYNKKTPKGPAVSMEMTQHDGGDQRFDEDYDVIPFDVTIEHLRCPRESDCC